MIFGAIQVRQWDWYTQRMKKERVIVDLIMETKKMYDFYTTFKA